MDYPYSSIKINSREVSLNHIVEEKEVPLTSFEKKTFEFIRLWLTGHEKFTLHTSGSTGAPKPIQINRAQMIASALLTQQALGLKREDHALVCLDTSYIAGQMMLVRCFSIGMYIIATEPRSNPLDNLTDPKINFVALVPYQVYHILQSPYKSKLNQIDIVIVGGAVLNLALKERLNELTNACYATFGMTETISHIALQRLNGPLASNIFYTLPGVKISKDERECLVISAPYLNEKQITNDLVEIFNTTSFSWLGRFDNVINSGGVKVSPEKIEQTVEKIFSELNFDYRFVITSIPDLSLNEKIVLVIEGFERDTELEKMMFERFSERLPPFHIPKKILYQATLPETNTGKLNRVEIKQILNKLLHN